MNAPRVVGLDMSLAGTGIADAAGWVELIGRKGVTRLPLVARVAAVDALVLAILDMVGCPSLVVVEAPAFSRSGGGVLERSALWWLVVRDLHRKGVPVATAPPTCRARYATGAGNSGKSAVIHAVTRRLPGFETGGNDNLVDAVALVAMGADWLGRPLVEMPKAHREALKGVTWPDMVSDQ